MTQEHAKSRFQTAGSLAVGLACIGLLCRLFLLEGLAAGDPGTKPQSLEAVQLLLGSAWWTFAGVMHVLIATGLSMLAAGMARPADRFASLGRVAAIIGASCFLLVGMSHFQLMTNLDSSENVCGVNAHNTMVAYNLLRVVARDSGMLALGAFLLLNATAYRNARHKYTVQFWLALSAGVIAILFSVSKNPSVSITMVALVAIASWSAGQLFPGGSHDLRDSGQDEF